MSTSELERERAYVSTLYARLDELQREAREQLDAVRRQDVGGNHQSRSERDAFARMYEDRIVQLRDVDERLAFGRLELAGYDEPEYRYIGRVGLRDAEQRPLLVDWRAPQASAFYQATAEDAAGHPRPPPPAVQGPAHPPHRRRGVRRRPAPGRPDGAAGRRRPARRPHHPAHRAHARHRRDHPGRAGPNHPVRPGGRARRAGRPGHRQDRRRAAPRRVPALLAPGPAEVFRRAHRRPVPLVHALHRGGAALPRRIGRGALQRRPALSRGGRGGRGCAGGRRAERLGRHGEPHRPRRALPATGAGGPAGSSR